MLKPLSCRPLDTSGNLQVELQLEDSRQSNIHMFSSKKLIMLQLAPIPNWKRAVVPVWAPLPTVRTRKGSTRLDGSLQSMLEAKA